MGPVYRRDMGCQQNDKHPPATLHGRSRELQDRRTIVRGTRVALRRRHSAPWGIRTRGFEREIRTPAEKIRKWVDVTRESVAMQTTVIEARPGRPSRFQIGLITESKGTWYQMHEHSVYRRHTDQPDYFYRSHAPRLAGRPRSQARLQSSQLSWTEPCSLVP